MTVTEYAKKIAIKIYNNQDNYKEIIKEAERVLDNSNIKQESKDEFWVILYKELSSKPVVCMDSQDSGDLNKLLYAAKAAIAAKTKK
ncbi:hypothetical protein [Serratia sp. JSRIV004]|uniref:hypothetical protein n=1 Tax=Serratia sp. JSRIV004 TaxID=2831895 RepID=UPI001CBCD05D|nr:hypothetical protein [Serratia sp. JSRIV004]UAN60155.1 hypothetical protein KGP21_14330 [Serratia sp. JSRIV004]